MHYSIIKNVLIGIVFCLVHNNCYSQSQLGNATAVIFPEEKKSIDKKVKRTYPKKTPITEAPTIIITEYQELDQATGQLLDRFSTLQASKKIKIAPSVSAFTIHFSLVDQFYSNNNGFAYKIEGLENDWNEIKENYIRIYNLPYGSYVLIIKGQRYNGEWTTNNLTVPIEVLKPYYLEWWFFVSIGLSIMGLSFLLFKNRLIRLEQSKSELEQLVQLRTKKIQEDKILIEQQYKELASLNQTKDKLFTIIAHDLRDPANTFIGLSKKLRYLIQHQQWKRLESFGGYMEQSADSLHKMLNNLLVWASAQQGNISCIQETFLLTSILEELLPVYEIKAKEHEIHINKELAAPTLSLFADREMFAIILRNIMDNALKFSKKGNTVTIQAFEKDNEIIVSVQDEGIGIPPELIPQLFSLKPEKIRRGVRGIKGAGLGLSLCKELTELNNGRIKVENTYPKGAKISLYFPNGLFIKELSPIEPSFSEV